MVLDRPYRLLSSVAIHMAQRNNMEPSSALWLTQSQVYITLGHSKPTYLRRWLHTYL